MFITLSVNHKGEKLCLAQVLTLNLFLVKALDTIQRDQALYATLTVNKSDAVWAVRTLGHEMMIK